jgi:hypothetical protein
VGKIGSALRTQHEAQKSAEEGMTFNTVRTIGLTLPGVVEGTCYGAPALKVGGRMFACMASHRSAEPQSLVVRLSFEQRDELIAADPQTYYLTEHYLNYPTVLVRLRRVHRDALRDLLATAHRSGTARPKRSAARERRGQR